MNKLSRTRLLAAGLVAAVTFLVFLPSLQNDFLNWDDDAYICKNFFIRSLDARLATSAWITFQASNWHPLTWFSHALDYAVWGLNPLGHHLTNNLLHAANAFVAVLLATRLLELARARGGGPIESGLSDRAVLIAGTATGLLFGLHPLHVESVAWVSERKDVLCGLFFLMAVMIYSGYGSKLQEGASPSLHKAFGNKLYLTTLGLLILALLSKPMAVSLPLVLLILDWYPLGRVRSLKTLGAAIGEKFPFLVCAAASAVVTVFAQRAGGALTAAAMIPPATRILVASGSLIAYLLKMLLPIRLVPFYPYPPKVSLFSLEYGLPVLVAFSVTAACILAVRSSRNWWLAAWSYYVITLIPVLGLVQVGEQSMADRYAYLPSFAPFMVFGLIAAKADARVLTRTRGQILFRTAYVAVAVILAVALSYATVKQIGIWKNSIVFWKSVIDKEPSLYFAHDNLGDAYATAHQPDLAMAEYQEALRLNPYYALAHNNVGAEYLSRKQYDAAIERFRTAIRLKPDFALAHYNLGYAYFFTGRLEPAIEEYRASLRLNPDTAVVHYDLGNAYFTNGQFERAIEQYLFALSLDPNAATYYNLGNAYLSTNRYDLAIEHFASALRLNPDFVDAHFNLALAYRKSGFPDKARAQFRKVLAIKPDDDEARKQLATLP